VNEQIPGVEETAQEVAAEIPPTQPPFEETPVPGPPMEPVQEPERIYALDVLRGFAIFGIFMVNIAFFSMPLMNAIGQGVGEETAADRIAHSIVKAFFEFKFVSTFSLLFGMGLVIQMSRAAKRNRPFVGLYLRRTFLLMAMGAMHGLLLWYGDILFIYSFAAILLLLLRNIRPKMMLWLAAGALVLSVLIGGSVNFASIFLSRMSGATEQQVDSAVEANSPSAENEDALVADDNGPVSAVDQQVSIAETADGADPESAVEDGDEPVGGMDRFFEVLKEGFNEQGPGGWVEAEVIAYKQGPMLATLIMRAVTFGGMLVFACVLGGFGLRVVTMFLLGVALMKLNFFDLKHRLWHVRFCLFGLALGIPGELSVIAIHYSIDHQINYGWAAAESLHQITSFFLCLGYVGALTLIVQAGALRWLTYAFSCVGRTALSNYLLQTIVATYIMYWWGLGLFNDVGRPTQLAMVVGIYAVQLVLSVLYLRVFRIGPFEWLWRSLTYLKLQPILRQKESVPPTAG
jgi:uncharacterized protein